MATRTITAIDDVLLTALGGTVSNTDTVYVDRGGNNFTSADLTAADLTAFKITAGFSGQFSSANGGQLKLVVNQTSTGVFTNESNSPLIELRSSSSSGVIYEIRNRPASSGTLQVSACKPTIIYHELRGVMKFESDVDLSAATIRTFSGETICRRTAGAATYPLLNGYVYGGTLTIERDAGTLYARGTGRIRLTYSDCSPTTINMDGGNVDVIQASAIGTLQGDAGTIDFTNSKTPLTVTTRACGPGVKIRLRRSHNITFSSVSGDYGGGPQIEYVD